MHGLICIVKNLLEKNMKKKKRGNHSSLEFNLILETK